MQPRVANEPQLPSPTQPVQLVFQDLHGIGAAFTLKGTSAENQYFSFERPPRSDPTNVTARFRANLTSLAKTLEFEPQNLTLPNGAWPHSGQTIKAEEYKWILNPRSRTIMPIDNDGRPTTYDAIVTRSKSFILSAQGADCPSVFFYDPESDVIGIAHAGWKPSVRGVIANTVKAMVELGAVPRNIMAHVSPGAGDRNNVFKWDEQMEPHIREVFVTANRLDLLHDSSVRHLLTSEDRLELSKALAKDIPEGAASLKLSELAVRELRRCGVPRHNISRDLASTILDSYHLPKGKPEAFMYHSYRRENPNHGLNMSVIFLKSDDDDDQS